MPNARSRARTPLVLLGSPDHRDVSDTELAQSLIAGEAWAVSETWHRFAPMVLRLAERALGSKPEAHDLTQEVFARLLRGEAALCDPNSLRSSIYSLAVRALGSQLRRRQRRAWFGFKRNETPVALRTVTLDLESRDRLRKFYGFLDRLSPRDRLVFLLKRVEFMTTEQIAKTMDISVSIVERSLSRASSRLSRWVESDAVFQSLPEGREKYPQQEE